MFREGLDPVELHWLISALCFFNVSNRATFSKIFKRDLGSKKSLTSLRERVVDMVRRYAAKALRPARATRKTKPDIDACRHMPRRMYELVRALTEEAATLRTSIATVSLSGDLVEKLEAIAAAGFDGDRDLRERLPGLGPFARSMSVRWSGTPVSP